MGQETSVEYLSGGIPVYLAEPENGNGVGVIIVSAIFGIDDDTKKMCDDLAGDGHPAMAINMFWEDEQDSGPLTLSPENAEKGKARASRLDREIGNAYIGTCIEHLKKRSSCNGKISVWGFCYGGPYVVQSAVRFNIDSGVSFHGSFVEKFLGEFKNVKCPLQFHYGDNDHVAPMEAVEQVKAACDEKTNAELFVYAGGEHGYMFPNRGAGYHEVAAKQSWERALSFIQRR